MKKMKLYRYLGRNGILTTYVLLDGINHIPLYRLTADEGYTLTNGEIESPMVEVSEEEISLWSEIPLKVKNNPLAY